MSLPDTRSLEPLIRRIGTEIFERADAAEPSIVSMEFWQQWAMNWLTANDELKLRLFRFMEVLPALRTPEAVADHLRQYLVEGGAPVETYPPVLQLAMSYGRPDSLLGRFVAWAAQFGCARMGRQFISGSTPDEARVALLRLRRAGMAFTLDVLGETVIADSVAHSHQQHYIHLIEALSAHAAAWRHHPVIDSAPWGALPRVNISIKLSAMVTKFDAINPAATTERVADRLRPVLRAAQRHGAFINVDMEHYAVKDLTLSIFQRVLGEPEFRDWPDCGVVIQCYTPDCDRDMADLIAWAHQRGTPITVRLVKGAYWDSETARAILSGQPIPLYTKKWQSDAAFERIAWTMLENSNVVRPAFASHNVRSLAAAMAFERAMELPPRTLEVQMLTGMGNPLKRALVDMDLRLRVYAPFGELMTGMAYFIRRLIENTANESFLRQTFGQHLPIDELLADPHHQQHIPDTPLPQVYRRDPEGTAPMTPFENEPVADFSKAETRERMQQALEDVRAALGGEYAALIGGEPVTTGAWLESYDPSRPHAIVGRVALCETAHVDQAVAAARKAFDGWRQTPVEERIAILRRAADALSADRFAAAAWLVYEAGKTWREAQADVMEAIDYLRFYALEAERLLGTSRRRDYPGEVNAYAYRPRGVVAVISPFSFPIALLSGMTAAALVAGNAVVVKPSSRVPVAAARLVALLNSCGLPPGVLNLTPGPGETIGGHLARHRDVDMVAFTGSSQVGRELMQLVREAPARHASIRHVIADMGGNNAIIVDDDADIDEAVQATIASAFGYSGQKCTSCSRVIALNDIYDDYLAKLVEAAGGIRPAAADLPDTTVGPLIDAGAVERARRYVEVGKQEARCVLGERAARSSGDEAGCFFPPVIFADVPPDARLAQEETLAPILAVMRAEDFDHALRLATSTAYALVGGVFSRSPRNIEMAKRRFDVGLLYINRQITVSRVDRQPFGGIGLSGLGIKTGGPDYLQQFMTARTISENTMRHGFAPANRPAETAAARK